MDRKPSACSCFAAAVAILLALASPADAKDDSQVAAQERAAKKACAMGDYQKGAEILTDLFLTTNDPTYIYNQARCYEQNNLWDRAIARFREYLRKAKHLTEKERAETEQHVAECEAAQSRALAPATPARSEQPSPAPAVGPQPAATVGAEGIPAVSRTPPTDGPGRNGSPGRGLRIAGVATGVVGLAAIGVGVGFALKTQAISSNEEKNGPTGAQEDDRKRYEAWGWVSYGVGAAALATGVILYIVGRSGDGPNQVALLPAASSTGAGLSLAGRF
jgi:hypothetical protein